MATATVLASEPSGDVLPSYNTVEPPQKSYSTTGEVDSKIATLRKTFRSGRTKDLRFRKWQLKQLYWLIDENKEEILQACHKDLGRHEYESLMADVNSVKDEVLYTLAHVESWAKDTIPDSGFLFTRVGKTYIRHEPLGTVLIIGPWNYPVSLIFNPLASAIAAGCTALVKPSEIAAACAELITRLIPKYLDPTAYAAVTGSVAETGYILSQKVDHIFFTGSTPVARHVAAAAAKHLTPTTLELGGQGPAIITKSANVDLAAKRVAATKFMNAGQICLNVNHVLVDADVRVKFVERLKYWLTHFTSNGGAEQQATIVNEKNYDRLSGLLAKTEGKVVHGGQGKREVLRFDLTAVDGVSMEDSLLSEELFGPILPLVEADLQRAVEIISSLPHPLAIYLFSHDQSEVKYLLDHTSSGGVTVNDTILHAAAPEVPFGGVGDSGSGAYHGRYGFDAFTHRRAVVQMPDALDRLMGFRYPPYDMQKNGSMVARKAPPFKRGETLEDQQVGVGSLMWWRRMGSGVLLTGLLALAVQQGYLRPEVGRRAR